MKAHWLICLFVVGCSVEDTRFAEQEAGANPCPPHLCLNSPVLRTYGMHELNLFGDKTEEGLAFETVPGTDQPAIFIAGVPFLLVAESDRLYAYEKLSLPRLEGQQLVNAELHVLKYGTPVFNIRIEAVRPVAYAFDAAKFTEAYRMTWYDPTTNAVNKAVCTSPVAYDGKDTLLGMNFDETLVFTGDRIDRHRYTIERDPKNEWLSFGCAGQTLAKLQLTGHTSSSNKASSWRGNQAMLKMLAGDYCGKGVPITVGGTPLRWKGGLFQTYQPTPGKLEARWNENGATCVNTMRLDFYPSPDFPTPWKTMLESCQPAPCSNSDINDYDGALRVSAIPL